MLQIDRATLARGLVGGEHDAEAVDGVVEVVGEIDVVLDRAQQVFLFAAAELVVVGLVGRVDPLGGLRELVVLVAVLAVNEASRVLRLRLSTWTIKGWLRSA